MADSNLFNIPITRHRRKRGSAGIKHLLKWVIVITITSTVAVLLPLRWIDPPTSSYIMRYEKAAKRPAKQQWVDLENMSWSMPVAAIAAEDQRFPTHWGLDVRQIHYALKNNTERKIPLGASTITQQTIKNLYLWPSRSLFRKGLEAWLSIWLEILLPKKRILEIYLNIAQFGKSVFGVGVASQHYYSKDISRVSSYEACLLAASLPTPSSSNPAKPSTYLKKRGRALVKQMRLLGGRNVITEL